jgi:hypothetical protein
MLMTQSEPQRAQRTQNSQKFSVLCPLCALCGSDVALNIKTLVDLCDLTECGRLSRLRAQIFQIIASQKKRRAHNARRLTDVFNN